jgi:hypothetical protein
MVSLLSLISIIFLKQNSSDKIISLLIPRKSLTLMDQKDKNLITVFSYPVGEFIGFKWARTQDLPELEDSSFKNVDWAGFYTCLDLKTAEGYLVNRLPEDGNGNGIVYIHRIYLKKELPIVICKDKGFQDGNYKTSGTVDSVKKELREKHYIDVNQSDSLIPRLGELGYGFRCYHDEDETEEVVIPHNLKQEYLSSKCIAKYTFRKYNIISVEDKE